MKKLTTTLLITTLVVGGMTVAGTSMARYGGGGCDGRGTTASMHGPGRMAGSGHAGKGIAGILRLEKNLDLSREQRTAIRKIMKDARIAGRVQRDALSDNRLALHDLMQAGELNEQELRGLMKVKADNMTELMLLRARTRAAVQAQLSDVQREKMAELYRSRGY